MIDKTLYTPGMREVFKLAEKEASRLRHNHIGPEHYLLAIIRKGDGLAVETLLNLNIDFPELNQLKTEIEKLASRKKSPVAGGACCPNIKAKRVLDSAKAVSASMKNDWVGTEHLLLALIREEDTISSRVLRSLGLNYRRLKQAVLKTIADISSKTKEEAVALPLGAEIREILNLAQASAFSRRHGWVGIEDLLRALMRYCLQQP